MDIAKISDKKNERTKFNQQFIEATNSAEMAGQGVAHFTDLMRDHLKGQPGSFNRDIAIAILKSTKRDLQNSLREIDLALKISKED